MAGKSKKEMHHYMEFLLEILKCEHLSQVAEQYNIPLNTLREYAFYGRKIKVSEASMKLSEATGIPLQEILDGFNISRELVT